MKPTVQIALSEPYPLLDPGNYIALCTKADFAWAYQWKKWIAKLELQPQNYTGRAYIGTLCKFLGLGKNPERPYAGPQSDFRRLLVEANGDQPPSLKPEWISSSGCSTTSSLRQSRTTAMENPGCPCIGTALCGRFMSTKEGCDVATLQPFNTGNTDNPSNRPTQQHSEHTPGQAQGLALNHNLLGEVWVVGNSTISTTTPKVGKAAIAVFPAGQEKAPCQQLRLT
jgi:hypothetical protein